MLHVITNITHGRPQRRETVVGPRILRYTETSTGLAALEAKRYTRVLEIVLSSAGEFEYVEDRRWNVNVGVVNTEPAMGLARGLWYLEALEPSDLALPQVSGRGSARQQKVTPRKCLDKRQGGSFGNEFKFRDKSEEGTSFLPAVVGQDESNPGTHSTAFDPKYNVPDSLTINPRTHPGLFSFTGRWLLSPSRPTRPQNPVYQSTLWPGNSVTVLAHGTEISVKIVPKPQGWIEDYHFYVSVDGGEDVRYSIPAFNSTKLNKAEMATSFSVPIKELCSGNTIIFEGLEVQKTLINEGKGWMEEQDDRLSIEFVGEGSDAERESGFFGEHDIQNDDEPKPSFDIWRHSVQYRVGETLGVRHSHISAGTCLLTSCPDQAGLFDQYFQTSPFSLNWVESDSDLDPHHNSHLGAPYRFPELSTKPQVPIPPVNIVVVDLGVLDILTHRQNPDDYSHALVLFLARLRSQAHPAAQILVVARNSNYVASSSPPYALESTPEIKQLREKLYTATEKAVDVLRKEAADENIHLVLLPSTATSEASAYLQAICPFIVPSTSVLSKLSLNRFGRAATPSKAQKVCLELGGQEYGSGFRYLGWNLTLISIVIFGLWMSKSILVGASAALFGRKTLGMEEVEVERGLLNTGSAKKNENYDKSG
ncbi:uncharacterized protein LAJ45_11397 [Morchella importuna]|uniref:uncharacterized protein n=1 Tax=Morchella importuna TaxID=1174673 RepID=UPI001E8EB15E|nr:uncharacterized protein LAJ45_11397 [Morchella importuna]KAH8144629.1 hypothetical protein LAJ45_11397 [Morchella importuna]